MDGKADMAIPLVVCYSGSHYEGLVPATEEDVVRCMELVKQYKDGNYKLTDQDVPAIKDQLPVSKGVDIDAEYEEIKKVKPKERSEEQKKRFNAIKDARSKRKRSVEKVIKDKEMAKKRREDRSKDKVMDDREKNKSQMRTARATNSSFEGRSAAGLQRVPTIHELKDTKDTIGGMEHRCILFYI